MDVTANSGSVLDLQTAIDTVYAGGGGKVYIPDGVHRFNLFDSKIPRDNAGQMTGINVPGGVDVLSSPNAVLFCDIDCWASASGNPYADRMIWLDGRNGKPIRFSGPTLRGSINYDSPTINNTQQDGGNLVGIVESGVTDFRIDHIVTEDFSNSAISCQSAYIPARVGNCGVIDHVLINNPYKDVYYQSGFYPHWGYGIILGGSYGWSSQGKPANYWRSISEVFGQYGPDIIYIEDSEFRRCRHCTAGVGQSEGFYVIRHSTVTDNILENFGSFMDTHPGHRGFEAYNNTLIDVPIDIRSIADSRYWGQYLNSATTLYSGSGLFYNNNIQHCNKALMFGNPANTDATKVNGWWAWNNQLSADVAYPLVVQAGSPFPIRENAEYFLREPNFAQDGFTYTPYPYPHPLVSGATQSFLSVNSTVPARFTVQKL